MTPGQVLYEARRRHRVSQTGLARRAGTTQSAISRLERDRVSPSVETLETLLDLLGERLILVSEPVDYGHDRTLIRQNLELSPEQRLERTAVWAKQVQELQDELRR